MIDVIVDSNYLNFLEEMKVVGRVAKQLGNKYETPWRNKYIASSEFLNPTDFYICQISLWDPQRCPVLDFDIMLGRFLPRQDQRHNNNLWEQYVKIALGGDGVIDLRVNPKFYPAASEFEEPLPDPKFPKPRQITKELFLGDHWLVRGPVTSFGPRTRDFMYFFTTQTVDEILKA